MGAKIATANALIEARAAEKLRAPWIASLDIIGLPLTGFLAGVFWPSPWRVAVLVAFAAVQTVSITRRFHAYRKEATT